MIFTFGYVDHKLEIYQFNSINSFYSPISSQSHEDGGPHFKHELLKLAYSRLANIIQNPGKSVPVCKERNLRLWLHRISCSVAPLFLPNVLYGHRQTAKIHIAIGRERKANRRWKGYSVLACWLMGIHGKSSIHLYSTQSSRKRNILWLHIQVVVEQS